MTEVLLDLALGTLVVLNLFIDGSDLFFEVSVSFRNVLGLFNEISMFLGGLILSLALLGFYNGFKLLQSCIDTQFISESRQFLSMYSSEVVNGIFNDHVLLGNLLQLGLPLP